ncbi:hypothetical protein GUJ93_ZPchr0012g21909 [Zizania palustris]|uniref:Uncharacterized protein n=1 Tax=Zizania palustris TaxID=103762 RepID=A0A8J5WPY2_ZIZPA|nr:hypothetical protein GUJ93_ZPchr0012g21909 [Zizania palustris]
MHGSTNLQFDSDLSSPLAPACPFARYTGKRLPGDHLTHQPARRWSGVQAVTAARMPVIVAIGKLWAALVKLHTQ